MIVLVLCLMMAAFSLACGYSAIKKKHLVMGFFFIFQGVAVLKLATLIQL